MRNPARELHPVDKHFRNRKRKVAGEMDASGDGLSFSLQQSTLVLVGPLLSVALGTERVGSPTNCFVAGRPTSHSYTPADELGVTIAGVRVRLPVSSGGGTGKSSPNTPRRIRQASTGSGSASASASALAREEQRLLRSTISVSVRRPNMSSYSGVGFFATSRSGVEAAERARTSSAARSSGSPLTASFRTSRSEHRRTNARPDGFAVLSFGIATSSQRRRYRTALRNWSVLVRASSVPS